MPERPQAESAAKAPKATRSTPAGKAAGKAAGKPTGKPTESATKKAAAPRRQARGERRIAQLLDAAASVFCRTGYAAASTNAIAREAEVSPGTLYQFFPNKEAIAVHLGDELLRRARDMHGQAFLPENLDKPLPELLDAVLDPVIAFNCENPAFWALMHGSGIPGITQEREELHSGLLERVQGILRAFCPDGSPEELTRVSGMVLGIFKAALDLILASEGAERAAYVAEVKTVLLRYLEPMLTAPHLD
ncbi:TetR family transcriptional regulator [Streptomyces sp. NBC_01343]|uniref:TetR/AcrR family transcriptional regulator n=1 Tax=Streptomyces sp. NBC_01343 TaxID=2903832 RepID=UPI002E0EB78F|nr:TetR family transcriptional regulator [Streptomyces sp. NBC_01343]